MTTSVRSRVDGELTRRVGTWFTVREIQEKLRVNPATLKPLIMKYARESILKRRHVKGTARSVQFTPAAPSTNQFKQLLSKTLPYRATISAGSVMITSSKGSKKSASKGSNAKNNSSGNVSKKATPSKMPSRSGSKMSKTSNKATASKNTSKASSKKSSSRGSRK